jgi:hypothetical protein
MNGFNRGLAIGGLIVILFWIAAFGLWWYS